MIMDLLFFRIICRSIHLNLNKRIVHDTQYYDFFKKYTRYRVGVTKASTGVFTSQNISSVIHHIESLDVCMEH
jgi:hypothetical protein